MSVKVIYNGEQGTNIKATIKPMREDIFLELKKKAPDAILPIMPSDGSEVLTVKCKELELDTS